MKSRGVNGYSELRKFEGSGDIFEGNLTSWNFENSFDPFKISPISWHFEDFGDTKLALYTGVSKTVVSDLKFVQCHGTSKMVVTQS